MEESAREKGEVDQLVLILCQLAVQQVVVSKEKGANQQLPWLYSITTVAAYLNGMSYSSDHPLLGQMTQKMATNFLPLLTKLEKNHSLTVK